MARKSTMDPSDLQTYEDIAAEIRELLPDPDGAFTNDGFDLWRLVRRWRKTLQLQETRIK